MEIEDFLGAKPVGGTGDAAEGEGGKGTSGIDPMRSGSPLAPPIQHLSASSLSMLAICPRQFQQRYILGRKEPPSQAQVVGTSFHTAMEYNYRQKLVSHEDLPIEDVVDYYNDAAWPNAVESAGGAGNIKWTTMTDAKLTGAVMTTSYRREIAPTIQPVEVEHEFSITVPDVPVPIVGKIDVIDADTIIDLKTSKRKVIKMKPAWRNQIKIYQLVTPRDAAFHVISNKGENLVGDFELRYSSPAWLATERWVLQMYRLVEHFWGLYGELDWPTTGTAHDWRCDWCAYKPDCPAWKR